MTPLYIVVQKLMYISGLLPLLLPVKKSTPKSEDITQSDIKPKVSYSFLKGICRLTFSLYLINYYCIRYDFLTSRVPFQAGIYHAVSIV